MSETMLRGPRRRGPTVPPLGLAASLSVDSLSFFGLTSSQTVGRPRSTRAAQPTSRGAPALSEAKDSVPVNLIYIQTEVSVRKGAELFLPGSSAGSFTQASF